MDKSPEARNPTPDRIENLPPVEETDWPETRLKLDPTPEVEEPTERLIEPACPTEDLPVDNESEPDVAPVPVETKIGPVVKSVASAEAIVTLPEALAAVAPLCRIILPPVLNEE